MADSPSNCVESIYTDGACSGNPGPGGWGTVLYLTGDRRHELGGGDANTTNNRMEIQAAIAALEALTKLDQREPTTLYTDSQYVQNGITKWIHGWKKKGWKTAGGKPVLNQDLWEDLDRLHRQVNAQLNAPLRWAYVRGHSGNAGNERCDAIARAFAAGERPKLTQVPSLFAPASPSQKGTPKGTSSGALANESSAAPSVAPSADNLAPNPAKPQPKATQTDIIPIEQTLARLRAADELAHHGYLITSTELMALTDLSEQAIEQLGSSWIWRNWEVAQIQQTHTPQTDSPIPGGDRLWQLSRID